MKRPIDLQREGGAQASVPDGKPIIRMFVFADRLFFMTPSSIFAAKLADEIDPERLNSAIPQVVQQEELAYGADDDLVRGTVSITDELLKNGAPHLPEGFDIARSQALALETAQELAAISDEIRWLHSKQEEVNEGLAAGRWNRAFIPRTQNLRGRTEQALSHARQAALNIIAIGELFYPRARPNLPWRAALEGALHRHLPADDPFLATFGEIADDLESAIQHRNAAVHPDKMKWVRCLDHELSPNDKVLAPTIEIMHPAWAVDRTDVCQYLEVRLGELIAAYELVLAICCDRNVRNFGPFVTFVAQRPPDSEADARFHWVTQVREGEQFPPEAGNNAGA